jgi:hypothetical protein
MDIYSDYLNENAASIQASKTFKGWCAGTWLKYDDIKNGWIKDLYTTIKNHPHRPWTKSLHFPTKTLASDFLLDVVFCPSGTQPKGYYFLSIRSSEISCCKHMNGKFYCTYVKPRKPIADYFDRYLIEGLSSFELVGQKGEGNHLLIARCRSGIGSYWAGLLPDSEAAKCTKNPHTRKARA